MISNPYIRRLAHESAIASKDYGKSPYAIPVSVQVPEGSVTVYHWDEAAIKRDADSIKRAIEQ